ncbi:biotin-independent malonate decarboxylase subunit gamma [Robbsia sp. Bb-Pol-6]|uniref:Biotin-independent malonate decarboxylase subunit gamma n=1 Tax=Robbsia betulipollinis TaxID=2981849 RepID=A0ABT3ZKG7_9BURK|nr:biotin-independent malonate decarboxylase subunit gamma [Robbsia betulipollinis]MCY0387025.1 biotin-independent malonate decarboxylase subunit gamma [Robbsia betulipollinis]
MNDTSTPHSRGRIWLQALSGQQGRTVGTLRSVLHADAPLGDAQSGDAQSGDAQSGDAGPDAAPVRFIAVVPDPQNHFPRARAGEVGLEEGWALARVVRDTIAAGAAPAPDGARQPIVAIVDVSSQAYGRREELMGVHMACAAAANAYADARLAGHPVLALIVGKAMSGAFLAHGYQANRIIALDDPGVLIHAMGQAAAARVTRRTVEQLNELGNRFPPMSYDVKNYAKLGMLDALLEGVNPDAPDPAALARVRTALAQALAAVRASGSRDLTGRYASPQAQTLRAASIEVRKRLAQQW